MLLFNHTKSANQYYDSGWAPIDSLRNEEAER